MSLQTILRYYSARLLLFALVGIGIYAQWVPQPIDPFEFIGLVLVGLVYFIWVPLEILVVIALALLFLAAGFYKPLKEAYTEGLLRFMYYLLVLTVSREILNVLVSPLPAVARFRNYIRIIEQYHYEGLVKIVTGFKYTVHYLIHVIILSKMIPPFLQRVYRKTYTTAEKWGIVKHARLIFFLLLTLVVVWPWFTQPGYLFLLDNVWTPTLTIPSERLQPGFITSVPHEWLFWVLSYIVPTSIIQKSMWTLIIFIAGLSTSQLVSWILKETKDKDNILIPALIAGTFYALNPFVITRLFMGQMYFLLAYALMPWALLAILRFLQKPTIKNGSITTLSLIAVLITSAHHLILVPLLIGPICISIFFYPHIWRKAVITLVPVSIFFGIFLFVFFIRSTIPLDPQGPWARLLQAPYTGSVELDIVSLTASWKTNLLFAFPHEVLPAFTFFIILFSCLMGLGVWYIKKEKTVHRSLFTWQLLVIAGISFFLANGVSHPLTTPISQWLYIHIPGWVGMRDSGKFMANLALIESIFLGAGVAILGRKIHPVLSTLVLVGMLIFVSPAYSGFDGQVLPQQYPVSWTKAKEILSQEKGKPKVIIFPWYSYSVLEFLDNRVVINPAANFFNEVETVMGDGDAIGGIGKSIRIAPQSKRVISKKVKKFLDSRETVTKVGATLAEEHVSYVVLLADDIDADKYEFLYRQKDLEKLIDSPELVLWKNLAR